MSSDSFLGLSWWLWVLVVAGLAVPAMLLRQAAARARRRKHAEELAQAGDAAHEGAMTRHEGGA